MIIVHIQWCAFRSIYITKPDRGASVKQHMWLFGFNHQRILTGWKKSAWSCKDKEQHCCQILLWVTSCASHRNTMSWTAEWPCGHVDRFKTSPQDKSETDPLEPTARSISSLRPHGWFLSKLVSRQRTEVSFRDLIDTKFKNCHIFPENQQALKKLYISGLKEQCQENVRLAEVARGQAWGRIYYELLDEVQASGEWRSQVLQEPESV